MDGFQQTPRKDLVEEYWVEFLTFIKQKEVERQKRFKQDRLAEIKRLATVDEPPRYISGYETEACTKENDYYGANVYDFWRWYSNEKIDLDS